MSQALNRFIYYHANEKFIPSEPVTLEEKCIATSLDYQEEEGKEDNYNDVCCLFVLVAVIIFLGAFAYKIEHVHQKERDVWKQERKELYDRIQAPSFAEYKQGK